MGFIPTPIRPEKDDLLIEEKELYGFTLDCETSNAIKKITELTDAVNTLRETIKKAKEELNELGDKGINKKRETVATCCPPNLTYCKAEIYPDYDCESCKWYKGKKQITKL